MTTTPVSDPQGSTCEAAVPNRYGPFSHQCTFKPFHSHHGRWFCKRHDPCKRHVGEVDWDWSTAKAWAEKGWTK